MTLVSEDLLGVLRWGDVVALKAYKHNRSGRRSKLLNPLVNPVKHGRVKGYMLPENVF